MKQETLEEYTEDYKPSFVDLADTLPKQETLEEFSERYANMQEDVSETIGKYLVKAVFKDGAYWNKEKIYNEIKELYDNENITGFSKLAYAKCLDIIKNK